MHDSPLTSSDAQKQTAWTAALGRLLAGRWFWMVLLAVCAGAYHGSYDRHSLNFKDEGGTIVLGAQRLLEGQLPLKDVVLNYNLLWFYPVVGLFKVFGVSYVLLRTYCFALSTLTVLLAFLAVEKVSRRPWFAFLVALLPLLVPGMTFKNYMPLLAVSNSLCLLLAALEEDPRRWLRHALLGGCVLGLTFLIRIDLGFFFSALWAGFLLLRCFERGLPRKAFQTGAGLLLVAGTALLLHGPVYADARQRGFDREFVGQYGGWFSYLRTSLRLLSHPSEQGARPQAAAAGAAKTATVAASRDVLGRRPVQDIFRGANRQERSLAFLTYAAPATLGVLVLWAFLAFIRGLFSREPHATRRPLAALLMLGGALTTFPQFFFFRPDAPHLSEFAPGYWVGAVCASLLLGAHEGSWRSPSRWFGRLILGFLLVQSAVYLAQMLPDRWTGTIAARKARKKLFEAENGVRVFVSTKEQKGLQGALEVIRAHSKPGEYLVAYPYHPTFNVLANRPTYERNVYVDNAMRSANWDAEAIARFQTYRPAVIVLSDWEVNDTPASRFSVWAQPTKAWIQENYRYQGTFLDAYEIYTRP